ncbi:MAG: hypothetical protein HN919_00910 [Verrucomicrobia bacterium]|jgi:hypothetical protein|nr:hypothetical protein [Verrucomicrobiota bacterium]
MSGFLLTIGPSDTKTWPVSFGRSRPRRLYLHPPFRLAVCETVDPNAARTFRMADGQAWVEGEPRPTPRPDQSLSEWLASVDGSFRGVFFPAGCHKAILLADPYGSRPTFYCTQAQTPCASDKLASLSRAEHGLRSIRWEAILEALTLGSVLSQDTSLCDVQEVAAGCMVALAPGHPPASTRYQPPPNRAAKTRPRGLLADARALKHAVQCAVGDTWTEEDAVLLLSGGFDSRWILECAPRGRKALTVAERECREVDISRAIATLCGAEHTVRFSSQDKWLCMLQRGHLITAGLYDPFGTHLLYDAEVWSHELKHVCHGLLFDTVLKSYFTYPSEGAPSFNPATIPPFAYTVASGRFSDEYLRQILGILSAEGQAHLTDRLRAFEETTPRLRKGIMDFGYEHRLLGTVSRQVDLPMVLCYIEHLGVTGPIFHQDLWSWWRESNPRHRRPFTAFLLGLILAHGPTRRLPKGDINMTALQMFTRSLMAQAIPQRLRRAARSALHKRRPLSPTDASTKQTPAATRTVWGTEQAAEVMRQHDGRRLVEAGFAALKGLPCFDDAGLDMMLHQLKGEQPFDAHRMAFVSSIGHWRKWVEHPGDAPGLDDAHGDTLPTQDL